MIFRTKYSSTLITDQPWRRLAGMDPERVAGFPPEKNLWGGQLENTNLLKMGICLLNTFLKDFTKMPIKKHTVLQFDGGGISPLAKLMRGINPPRPPLCMKPWVVYGGHMHWKGGGHSDFRSISSIC